MNFVIILACFQNVSSNLIEVVSVVAREHHISKCNRFLINCRTEVVFLAHTYRFVYCLDMSPSQAIVDIQNGEILFDEILSSFKASVEGLTRQVVTFRADTCFFRNLTVFQFTIPGNSLVFQPSLYLTVMVNTPFFMSPAQQVLVKGVQITSSNLQEIVSFVQNQFHLLEGKIADVTAMVHDQDEFQKVTLRESKKNRKLVIEVAYFRCNMKESWVVYLISQKTKKLFPKYQWYRLMPIL